MDGRAVAKLVNDVREAIHLAERRAQDRRFGRTHWERWRIFALNQAWAAARERHVADSQLVDAIGDAAINAVRERIEAHEDADREAVRRRLQADTKTLVRCEEALASGNELLTHFAIQTLREMSERYGLTEEARL